MIIGIDANEANLTQNRVGINQYAFYLLHALRNLKTNHKFIIYLKNKPLGDLPGERADWNYRVIPFPALWTQTRLPFDLFAHSPRPSVIFSMTHYAPRWSPIPSVVSIMDLGFLNNPEQFTSKDFNQLKNWTSYSVRKAKKIIAISEATRADIIKIYGKSKEDIFVTPLAYDRKIFNRTHTKSETDAVLSKYQIKVPYLFFLGSLKPNKNIEGLVKAFSRLIEDKKYEDFSLVIAGKKAWLYETIFRLVRELNLEGKITFTDFIQEQEVSVLMSEAAVFVLPSFHEGFGIPVLEAMACGTPAVVSRVASLPEVAGNAGIYVDPFNVNSIVEGIKTAISNRPKYVKKSLSRVKLFDWQKTAQKTVKILEELE